MKTFRFLRLPLLFMVSAGLYTPKHFKTQIKKIALLTLLMSPVWLHAQSHNYNGVYKTAQLRKFDPPSTPGQLRVYQFTGNYIHFTLSYQDANGRPAMINDTALLSGDTATAIIQKDTLKIAFRNGTAGVGLRKQPSAGQPAGITGKFDPYETYFRTSLNVEFADSRPAGAPVTILPVKTMAPPVLSSPPLNDDEDLAIGEITTGANTSAKPGSTVTEVRVPPQFPGGDTALKQFIRQHIHVPQAALYNKISGTVTVQFLVSTTGKRSNITTVGKVNGYGMEAEAVRLIQSMPDWIPGKFNGRVTTGSATVPVHFDIAVKE